MNITDHNYLSLQYWQKVFKKNGIEFQTFFEDIMLCLYDDFRKIKAYGNIGDKKNDGFRDKVGIYYQVYAPEQASDKQGKAIKKLKGDFAGLYKDWNKTIPINEYYFVFNDKDQGLAVHFFTDALVSLRKQYPRIKFDVLTPVKLEKEFLKLSEEDKFKLGFDINARNIVKVVSDFFEEAEIELDRECLQLALRILTKTKEQVDLLDDKGVTLEYRILKARILRDMDKFYEAKEIYESLSKLYPKDPRSLIYLAELELNQGKPERNLELLKQAKSIDPDHWLLEVQTLFRDLKLGNAIDPSLIDEFSLPPDKKKKSVLCRIFAYYYEGNKEYKTSDQFIEMAIQLNPDRLQNYIAQALFLHDRLFYNNQDKASSDQSINLLNLIDLVINRFELWGSDNKKEMIQLLTVKLHPLMALKKNKVLDNTLGQLFKLCINSNYDSTVERAFLHLMSVSMPDDNFSELLNYINKHKIASNVPLTKLVIYNFLERGELFTRGKSFFKDNKTEKALQFIKSLEENNLDGVLGFIENDLRYMITIASELKDFPEIKYELLKKLEQNSVPDIELFLMHFYHENNNIAKAYDYLVKVDLSHIPVPQLKICADISRKAQDWEKELEILGEWLQAEKDKQEQCRIKLAKCIALGNLCDFKEVVSVGEDLLDEELLTHLMDRENKEKLLNNVIYAHMQRNQLDQAIQLLEKHSDIPFSFQFKRDVEANLYFRSGETGKAIKEIVEGVKQTKYLTEDQYASLFLSLLRVGNDYVFSLDSKGTVENNSFVKIKGEDKWFYLGDEEELDALKLTATDNKYNILINKNIGDNLQFPEDKYSGIGLRTVEYVLPLAEYIFWRARFYHGKLARLTTKYGQYIVSEKIEGEFDFSNLFAYLEDSHKPDNEFYEKYIAQPFPLAVLAMQQGGLISAIGKVAREDKGFIRICEGTADDNSQQELIAQKILDGSDVYLDATSATFLVEKGFLCKIKEHIPNLKVPQSVINYLHRIIEQQRITPKTVGYMEYLNGQVSFSAVNPKAHKPVLDNIQESIKLLENGSVSIETVSTARRHASNIESLIPAELCDSCILAQENNSVVLTDDYLYLQANSAETEKPIPEYTSSFSLMKTLFRKKLITSEDYLDYFSYLSHYRCKFLTIDINDLMIAVFGNGDVSSFKPENLRGFNLSFTLSEEYGVPLINAIRFMALFLATIIEDDSVTPDSASNIFNEFISEFLKGKGLNEKVAVSVLPKLCRRLIVEKQSSLIVTSSFNLMKEKLITLNDQMKLLVSDILV